MKIFKSAVVGCGAIAPNHIDAIARCPYTKLVAVCDIDEKRAKDTSDKHDCKYYTDYLDLLGDDTIDVVHICTPHYLHAQMAIDAMRAGKHVLTEKPMAITVSDAREMIKVSDETQKSLGICFQNRFNTTSSRIKEVIDSGKVGKVLGAKAFVTWNRDEKYYNSAKWRGTWEQEGGGVLINQSIHTLDLLQWFIGDISKIKASVDTRVLNHVIEVEDTAEATIIFKNGARAIFYATNCYLANSPVEIEIICEKAVLKLSDGLTINYDNGETEVVTDIDKATGEKSYWGTGHKVLIHDFYEKLRNKQRFSIDGLQGVKTIELIQGIYKSWESKEYVEL